MKTYKDQHGSSHGWFGAPGSLIENRYQLRQVLGSGAMGVVYWASDCREAAAVAIKVATSDHEALRIRYRREAALQRRIAHETVPRVLAEGEVNGRPYLVFPYIDGRTLETVAGALPGERLLCAHASWVTIEIARALAAAHAAGVVHRDVKPANAMVDTDGSLSLIDFGLSIGFGAASALRTAPAERSGVERSDGAVRLTDGGNALGTPAFISPEQAMGRDRAEVTPLSDIYSAGCSLFTLVTGKYPFDYDTDQRMLRAHVEEEIPDPRRHVRDVPKLLALAIRKAAARRPEDRFQSAGELIRELRRACRPEPLPPALVGGLTADQAGGSTAQEPAVA